MRWFLATINILVVKLFFFASCETGANEQVVLHCLPDQMKLNLATLHPFYGRLYALASSSTCETYGTGGKETQLTLPLQNSECGTFQEAPDVFVSIVIIQHHALVQQRGDRALRLVCDFRIMNFTVSNAFNMANIDQSHVGRIVNSSAPSPRVRLRILDKNGMDVTDTQLGQELILKVEIDDNSVFGLAPRGLIASSGHSKEHIELLDGNGCPIDKHIFPGLHAYKNSKDLQGHFQAFKFSDDVIVRFHLNVQFCIKECPSINCDIINSVATKLMHKRSAWERNLSLNAASLTDPFLPLQREIIVDGSLITNRPYPPTLSTNNEVAEIMEDDALCVTKTVLILIIVASTILQICIVVTCIICIWVSKRYSRDQSDTSSSEHILIEPQNGDTIFYSDGYRTRL